jgi:hypothetical protein
MWMSRSAPCRSDMCGLISGRWAFQTRGSDGGFKQLTKGAPDERRASGAPWRRQQPRASKKRPGTCPRSRSTGHELYRRRDRDSFTRQAGTKYLRLRGSMMPATASWGACSAIFRIASASACLLRSRRALTSVATVAPEAAGSRVGSWTVRSAVANSCPPIT